MAVVAVAVATVITALLSAVVVLGHTLPAEAHSCSGVQINPGQDLDAIVNNDPSTRATTFCVHAPSSGATYTVNNSVILRSGDKLLGEPGQVITRGPASYGVPPVKIRDGSSGLENIVEPRGSNVVLRWVDIAGGVKGIDGYGATPSARLEYLAIHDNTRLGIANMPGKLLHSNLYNNGTNPADWGWAAGAVKGVDEYEAAYNYVHDNPANGLWCDHRCSDSGAAMPNGFWVHHNLLVKNGRWGVRYEYSPIVASGVHSSQPTALIESNEIHANGFQGSSFGGASMWDAQNATFRNNFFGAKTIAGVSYATNNNRRAILFQDSGRADRTDLWNGDAVGNSLGGEAITNCGKPDNVVYCANNR
jgi:hypothetical protein